MLAIVPVFLLALKASAAAAGLERRATPEMVFAHFMVGVVDSYGASDWQNDINLAKQTGIDAFALNIGTDSWTDTQLSLAYTAANQLGFKLFISFDFAASPSFSDYNDNIVPRLKTYAPNGANVVWNGKALVSTFSGDGFNWSPVRSAVPTQLEIIPFYQAANTNNVGIDGAFNWNAWPSSNNQPINSTMTTAGDQYYIQQLGGRPYMANVSPWFFTHYSPSSYNKNWLFLSDTLLIDRWNEILSLQPQLVEITSWNDFGESHYIGPLHPSNTAVYAGGSTGAINWVTNMPHGAFRTIITPYIQAYKNGGSPQVTTEHIVYWYRPYPKATSCSDPNVGPPTGWQYPADAVWAATLLKSAATLTINGQNFNAPAGINYFAGPMNTGNPSFKLARNGATVLSGTGGLAIRNSGCTNYNFNAYSGVI